MKMSKYVAIVFSTAIIALASAPATAMDKIRTNSMSYYTGFPIFVADKLGLYKEHDIDTEPKYFPSGAPVIQAAAAKQWDITFPGAPLATLAGPKLGLVTIGFVTEEAAIYQMIGRPDDELCLTLISNAIGS